MKKIILLVSAILITSSAFAQWFDWGVKGGLNLATVTKIDDAKMKPSIYVGVFGEFQVLDWMTIQPEIVYSRQGFKLDGVLEQNTNVKTWNRLNYLNIPILAKFYVFDKLSVDFGPQFGILLNAKTRYKIDGNATKTDLNDMKNFDVSIPIGLSYKITEKFDVSARYNIGVTDVHDETNAKNGVIQLGVGYKF